MANSKTDVSTTSVPDPDPPADVSLGEKSHGNGTSKAQISEYEHATRSGSLSSGEHKSAKALEAGFAGVIEKDGVMIVDWDGPHDPHNPLNWSNKRKWIATLIVSAFTFISPVSSSMIAPASGQLALYLGITSPVILAMSTSVFVLGYAFGPLFFAPLSELYGRSWVLQFANAWYLVWNIACGGAETTVQLVVFRFLSGLGGSAPLAIGGGVLGDLWRTEERGRAIGLFSLAPFLGPVIGPVCGSWIAERSSWRWVFWSTSIVDGTIAVLGLIFLRETYPPVLLGRKASKLRKQLGIPVKGEGSERVTTPYEGTDRNWKHVFKKAIVRPVVLFATESIIQLLGVYFAFIYGLVYLILTTTPGIYMGIYRQTLGMAGLHYLALGVGFIGIGQFGARFMDPIYKRLKERNGGPGKPEYRLPLMVVGTLCLPTGLLLFGWAAEKHVHWVVADLGLAFIGAGTVLNFQTIQTYVIDAFTVHSASAVAAVSVLRSITGFGFPLFAPDMYDALGYGKGDTILAAFAIVVGCPAPWLFWAYGERIRARSPYATSS